MSRKFNTREIKEKIKLKLGEDIDFSKMIYIDSRTKMNLKCLKHNEWLM